MAGFVCFHQIRVWRIQWKCSKRIEVARFYFSLAPLQCRRVIAMMGVMLRTALGKGPDHFQQFFQLSRADRLCTRSGSVRHNRQLVDIRNRHFLEIERRSALGLIWVYNRLPEYTIRQVTVGLPEIIATVSQRTTGRWMRRLEGNLLAPNSCLCAST